MFYFYLKWVLGWVEAECIYILHSLHSHSTFQWSLFMIMYLKVHWDPNQPFFKTHFLFLRNSANVKGTQINLELSVHYNSLGCLLLIKVSSSLAQFMNLCQFETLHMMILMLNLGNELQIMCSIQWCTEYMLSNNMSVFHLGMHRWCQYGK